MIPFKNKRMSFIVIVLLLGVVSAKPLDAIETNDCIPSTVSTYIFYGDKIVSDLENISKKMANSKDVEEDLYDIEKYMIGLPQWYDLPRETESLVLDFSVQRTVIIQQAKQNPNNTQALNAQIELLRGNNIFYILFFNFLN